MEADQNITSISSEEIKDLFTLMVRARALEKGAMDALMQGLIPGFIHVAIGQEAAAAGICYPLRRDDYVYTHHRGHMHALAKGAEMKRIMAELFGKIDGLCKGKAGSIHVTDTEVGLLGGSGIVGGGIPIATGIALACKLRGANQVVACFFGDGAVDSGDFHEALNMASLWCLPIVYCCENNAWAQYTPQEMATKVLDVAKKAAAYDMPGVTLSGGDVLAVYKSAKEAIDRARKGEGPTLIECKTQRWYGHYVGDPQKYRSPEDVEKGQQTDPVANLESELIGKNILSQDKIEKIKGMAEVEANEAIKFATESPLPELNEIYTDVYFEGGK